MTKILRLIAACGWAVTFTSMAVAQGTSTHGGDKVKQLFQQGKFHGAKMVERFSPGTLDPGFDPTAVAWLQAHKSELAAALRTAAHRWVEDERPTCAVLAGSEMTLSLATCKPQVDELLDAVQMLLTITVDELEPGFGGRVALAVILAWHNAGGQIRWDQLEYDFDADLLQSSSRGTAIWLADAQKLLLVDAQRRGVLYDPFVSTHVDAPLAALPTNERVVCATMHNDGAAIASVKDGMLRVTDATGAVLTTSSLNVGSGVAPRITCSSSGSDLYVQFLSTAARWTGTAWKVMALAPTLRGATAVATKDGLLVSGGIVTVQGAGQLHLQTALCKDACTTVGALPQGTFDAPGVYDGRDNVYIWGGNGAGGPTAAGFVFDLDDQTWGSMTTINVPAARAQHTLTYAHDRLYVYGGRVRLDGGFDVFDLNDGAIYDTRSRLWHPMDTNFALPLRTSHHAVWTGSSLLILGGVQGGDLGDEPVTSIYTFTP